MFPIRDNIPSSRWPLITILIIGANIFAFYFEIHLPEHDLRDFIDDFGVVPANFDGLIPVPGHSYIPFFSSMFLHGSLLHIIMNLWSLWIFGDNVEDRMGKIRYLVFYMFCGVAAAIAHVLANPGSEIPAIGASGAIAGVLGAYFMMYPRAVVRTLIPIFFWPLFVDVPAFLYLGLWFASQLSAGTTQMSAEVVAAGIAWWAHIGGFVAGAILHPIFFKPRSASRV